jgi:hypothetical protein
VEQLATMRSRSSGDATGHNTSGRCSSLLELTHRRDLWLSPDDAEATTYWVLDRVDRLFQSGNVVAALLRWSELSLVPVCVVLIGDGPLSRWQACGVDYSGTRELVSIFFPPLAREAALQALSQWQPVVGRATDVPTWVRRAFLGAANSSVRASLSVCVCLSVCLAVWLSVYMWRCIFLWLCGYVYVSASMCLGKRVYGVFI